MTTSKPPLIYTSGNYNDLFATNLKIINSIGGGAVGSNNEVQFNNNGVLGSSPNFTYDKLTNVLVVGNTTLGVVNIGFFGNSAPRQNVYNDIGSLITALTTCGLIL